MNKTLATFMSVVAVMVLMVTLYYGITWEELKNKHESDNSVIDQYQINEN